MNTLKNSLTAILAAAVLVAGISIVGVASAKEPTLKKAQPNYVPFQAVSETAEVCDVPGGVGDIDRIEIDSQAAAGDFIVTSILFVAEAPAGGFIEVRLLQVDGVGFVVNTGNLIAGAFGRLAFEALGESLQTGAFLPQQIAASSAGSPDIIVTLACDATSVDNIEFPAGQIVVSGWKEASDTITVTYVD